MQYGTFDKWSQHKRVINKGEKAQFQLGNRYWFGHWQVKEVNYIPKAKNRQKNLYNLEDSDFVDHEEISEEALHRDIIMDGFFN